MSDKQDVAPDSTAARVALWRALHVEIDPPPHVLEDEIGLKLLAPDTGWHHRGDMHPHRSSRGRASIVARARFVEDLVAEQAGRGIGQYVILGAGLDSFAQRRPEVASRPKLFEIDQPGSQAWKRQRLIELGFGIPEWLKLVPVDFEAGGWEKQLAVGGFDADKPSVVASLGVSMYLSKNAIAATMRHAASFAAGSMFVMSFMLPLELVEPAERPGLRQMEKGARARGTPFTSFFAPPEILALAREAGFRDILHLSAADLTQRYFADRTDGLRPSSLEELIVATA